MKNPAIRTTLKERGKRLEQIRMLARLTEKEAAAITQVAPVTYKDWEKGKHPVPEKRIWYLVENLKLEGLDCNVEWVLHGVGDSPAKFAPTYNKNLIHPVGHVGAKEQIAKELAVFHQGYSDAVDYAMQDDGMLPIYIVGDLVAGIKLYGNDVKKAFGKTCIVTLKNEKKILRTVLESKTLKSYTLLCSNVATQQETVLHEVEVVSIAPVIWHRRLDV